jgi:hypothetical protein
MKKTTKRIIIIAAIAIAVIVVGIIGFRIIAKIIQGANPRRDTTYSVGAVTLRKQPLIKTLSYRGIVEGDPQVKVFTTVAGKFQANATLEGSYVGVDDVLTYINRDIVGQTYQPVTVRSPIAGIVKKFYFVDRGALVTVDKPVAEVANPTSIKIVLTVGEADLSKVKTGMEAVITSPFDEKISLPAQVYSVTPYVDSDTFSGSIIIKADNRNDMAKIGMSALINIIIGKSETFIVPLNAIQVDLNSAYVFLNNGNSAKRVAVQQGYAQGAGVEIVGDIKEGDQVITDGSFRLFDGAQITIVGAPAGQEDNSGNNKNRENASGQKPAGQQTDNSQQKLPERPDNKQ